MLQCLRYFSIAVLKHHDEQLEKLILAYVSRGMSRHDREAWQQLAGLLAEAGN